MSAVSVLGPDRLEESGSLLARLRVARHDVAGVFKGKRAIFKLTHRLEKAS
jgi:hypothetical protein